MNLSDFAFELPDSLIATHPVSPRDHSRLLAVPLKSEVFSHYRFHELETLLRPGDLLVMNNTKVIPARLFGEDSGGRRFELFLLKPAATDPLRWKCLVRPGRKIKSSLQVFFPEGVIAEVERHPDEFEANFSRLPSGDFLSWLERHGLPPLPPYIKREAAAADVGNYQTVYARENGSVAAPTAGLHFTSELLEKLRARGIATAEVTLHVGYGTFSKIKVESLDEHVMHEENFSVPPGLIEKMTATKAAGNRVIAVGTTSLRALESLAEGKLSGSTRLFITPGYTFRWVDGLVTNFHLPKSTLFILVAAFMGLEKTRECYAEAVREKYRFYSYGDAMLIL